MLFSFESLVKEKGMPLVMGILNVTPDSFSDGGQAFSSEAVVSKVNKLCNEGADIIDVGACSTAPCNRIVSVEEELKRLKSFLPLVIENSTVPVSVDTFRPEVAKYAISQGVSIINDESGCFSEGMAELAKTSGCGWIFMHTGNKSSSETAVYENGITNAVLNFFANMKKQAMDYGINLAQLSYDCGIGFGKSRDDDLELLANCDVLSKYSPLLVGVSRKRIIGELTGESDTQNRVQGSVAVARLLSQDGAGILRVHDVKETVEAVKL